MEPYWPWNQQPQCQPHAGQVHKTSHHLSFFFFKRQFIFNLYKLSSFTFLFCLKRVVWFNGASVGRRAWRLHPHADQTPGACLQCCIQPRWAAPGQRLLRQVCPYLEHAGTKGCWSKCYSLLIFHMRLIKWRLYWIKFLWPSGVWRRRGFLCIIFKWSLLRAFIWSKIHTVIHNIILKSTIILYI